MVPIDLAARFLLLENRNVIARSNTTTATMIPRYFAGRRPQEISI
jgi:hypothetical protein